MAFGHPEGFCLFERRNGEDCSTLVSQHGQGLGQGRSPTYVDQLSDVSLLQVVQDTSIVKVGQIGHVLSLFVLGRIQLLQDILLDGFLYMVFFK